MAALPSMPKRKRKPSRPSRKIRRRPLTQHKMCIRDSYLLRRILVQLIHADEGALRDVHIAQLLSLIHI